MLDIKIKLQPGGKPPVLGTDKASCYDLWAREVEQVHPWLYKVSLGVSIEPPEGYEVKLYARSNIGKTGWVLANSVGIGDEDYRGEYLAYFAKVGEDYDKIIGWTEPEEFGIEINNPFNYADTPELWIETEDMVQRSKMPQPIEEKQYFPFPYKAGERCAQFQIKKKVKSKIVIVDELSSTDRGSGGFGHTGNG